MKIIELAEWPIVDEDGKYPKDLWGNVGFLRDSSFSSWPQFYTDDGFNCYTFFTGLLDKIEDLVNKVNQYEAKILDLRGKVDKYRAEKVEVFNTKKEWPQHPNKEVDDLQNTIKHLRASAELDGLNEAPAPFSLVEQKRVDARVLTILKEGGFDIYDIIRLREGGLI